MKKGFRYRFRNGFLSHSRSFAEASKHLLIVVINASNTNCILSIFLYKTILNMLPRDTYGISNLRDTWAKTSVARKDGAEMK